MLGWGSGRTPELGQLESWVGSQGLEREWGCLGQGEWDAVTGGS